MVEDTIASIIALDEPEAAKSGANKAGSQKTRKTRTQRSRTADARKRRKAWDDEGEVAKSASSEQLIPVEFLSREPALPERFVAPPPSHVTRLSRDTPARWTFASLVLAAAAFALAAVGVTTNGWFARSLGSSDIAGWMFLAIGVAADLAALVTPICAARLWHSGRHGASCAGWAVWAMTLVFAIIAGIGFASVNIADVTAERASRASPAVTAAQSALSDAMAARDRECARGVGKYCREREAAVAERRQSLDAAMAPLHQTADPQADAAIKIVAWLSLGTLRPSSDDFAMLRLVLLALLPQMGGILLMVSRSATWPSQAVDVRNPDVLAVWKTTDLRQQAIIGPQPHALRAMNGPRGFA